MANDTLTLGTLTFGAKQIMQLSDAYRETAFKNPLITDNHTIQEDIVANQQIAVLGRIVKFTKKDAGAGLGGVDKLLGVTEKTWQPADLKMWIKIKQQQWKQTFTVWMSEKGMSRGDMTNTELAQFVLEMMTEGGLEDAIRIAWLSSLDAANVDDSPAGVLTSGIEVDDYNQFNGLFNQASAIAAANPTQRHTTIAANAQSTTALQYALGSTVAFDTFKDMLDKADSRIFEQDDAEIKCTRTLYRNYTNYLRSLPGVQGSWEVLQSGIQIPLFDGIRVVPFNIWDRYIRSDFSDGTKIYKPHRAVLTTKKNTRIGVDLASGIQDFEVWYSKDLETNNFRGMYRMDAKFIEDVLVQYAD